MIEIDGSTPTANAPRVGADFLAADVLSALTAPTR
jgi:hypothetical protein